MTNKINERPIKITIEQLQVKTGTISLDNTQCFAKISIDFEIKLQDIHNVIDKKLSVKDLNKLIKNRL